MGKREREGRRMRKEGLVKTWVILSRNIPVADGYKMS